MDHQHNAASRRTPLLANNDRAAAPEVAASMRSGGNGSSSSRSKIPALGAGGDSEGRGGPAQQFGITAGGGRGKRGERAGNERNYNSSNNSGGSTSSSTYSMAPHIPAGESGHQARTLRTGVAYTHRSSDSDIPAAPAAAPWFASSQEQQHAPPPAAAAGLLTAAATSDKVWNWWGGSRGGGKGGGAAAAAGEKGGVATGAAAEADVEMQRQRQPLGYRGLAAERETGRAAALTDEEEEDEDEEEESVWCFYCMPQLTYVERLLGWLICFMGGLIISGLSVGSFYDLFRGKSMKFAVAYTLGNCVGLLGTTFLVGPVRQIQGMADPSRLLTSCIFAGSLFLTLFFSLFLPLPLLVITCVCMQWLAYIWYSLSYIPYGQDTVLWCLRAVASQLR